MNHAVASGAVCVPLTRARNRVSGRPLAVRPNITTRPTSASVATFTSNDIGSPLKDLSTGYRNTRFCHTHRALVAQVAQRFVATLCSLDGRLRLLSHAMPSGASAVRGRLPLFRPPPRFPSMTPAPVAGPPETCRNRCGVCVTCRLPDRVASAGPSCGPGNPPQPSAAPAGSASAQSTYAAHRRSLRGDGQNR